MDPIAAPDTPCVHRPECPGCPRFGEEPVALSAQERLAQLCQEVGGPAPSFVAGTGRHHRYRARLAVRGVAGAPEIGLFALGTHRVVPIPACQVHAAEINAAVAHVRTALVESGLRPYDERTGTGLIRYLQLVVERRSRRVQVTIVANAQDPAAIAPLADRLPEARPDTWLHSLHFNSQVGVTNTILGRAFTTLRGEECVVETLGGASVYFPPGAFGQSNLGLFERIVEQVHGWTADCERVLELFSGVGALGLGLVAAGKHVAFNELAPDSLRGLQLGLRAFPSATAEVLAGRADDVVAQGVLDRGWDCAVVDPPRKGLGQPLVDELCRNGPERLIYVSCGLGSFETDLRRLSSAYRLRECCGYALFPFTDHVESVAWLEKAH